MKSTRLQAATLGGTPDEIEQTFYEALQQGDLSQLMACWAEEDDMVCVQPDGTRLIGAAAIRSVFEARFAKAPCNVQPHLVHRIDALASAVRHLLERVNTQTADGVHSAWLTVTNVYHKTPQGWRMVARHASPSAVQDRVEALQHPSVLH